MNDNKIIFGIIAATILILGGGVFLAQKVTSTPEVVSNSNAQAQVEQTSHDWGTIQLKGGDVRQTFTVANVGTEPLQLHGVQTSCMCTTAKVVINNQTSPSFGMHQKSNWVGEVSTGETAKIEVVFIPDYHGPSGVGPITRQVKVATNDPDSPEIEFLVSANVVKQ
jgi:hypothetical protein